MNLLTPCAALAAIIIAAPALRAQAPVSTDTNTLKVLRQTLAEQQRHPDRIVRVPTNPPPASPVSALPAEIPVIKPAAPRAAQASTQSSTTAALERQYLEGKLTARQYQKILADLERAASAPRPAVSPKASTGPQPALEPALPTPPPRQTEKQKKVSDVESKLEAMIKEKEARDRAAQTNAPAAPGPQATKRERLDFLLKQVIAGKLSDEEYKKEREKILAEKE